MITDKDFTDLHVHSTYSLLDGTAAPDEILKATKDLGRDYLAITDHGSIDGLIRFQKAAQKMDVKPIFGIELYMLEAWDHRKGCDCEWGAHRNLHLTAVAKTPAGFGKIVQACGFANTEGWGKAGKSGRPFLPMDYPLNNNWGGDVVIMTGCASSPFWNAKDGIELLAKYKEAFKDDLYAECMPIHDWPEQQTINSCAREAADLLGLKTVFTTDIHYVHPEDTQFHEVVLGLSQPGMTWNNPRRWKFDSHCSHLHTVEQLEFAFRKMGWSQEDIETAIKNTREIAEKTFHEIKPQEIVLPKVVDVPDAQEEDYFVRLVMDGLTKRGVSDRPGYLERAAREIELFTQKGFVRYMLMVWDVIKWSKQNGVMVGPSRGSVGGSLVAFALNITDLDPILHRLSFERFLAPDRNDMPDIDLDIEDRNRHLVEEYLREKYGRYNVARICTFSTMLGRTALKDVSRLFEVPLNEVTDACHHIVKPHESDERANYTIDDTIASGDPVMKAFAEKYPDVVAHASRLEGQVRGGGIHAAGFVVSPHDLRSYQWAHFVPRRDAVCVNWDKDDLEHMGLVKLDLLGLSTMSAISECLRLVKATSGKVIYLPDVPLDDKATYEMLSRGDTATVFQLDTPGTMKYCRELKPSNFEHIAAIPALWKPGPIQAGMTDRYREVRHGQRQPAYLSETHRKIVEITNGEWVYQEQVVSLLTDMAGFTYKDADKVRKVISKQQGQTAWAEWEEKFVQGCLKVGEIDEAKAREIWQGLSLFAIYCLNRAHSIGYGMVAYWCAYLKANYTAEWLCAWLNYGNADREDTKTGEVKRDVALREVQRLGMEILVPDINRSNVVWAVEKDEKGKARLRVGLQDIKFLGDKAREEIEKDKAARGGYRDIHDFLTRIDGHAVNKKVYKALLVCGAFDSISTPQEREQWVKKLDDLWNHWGKAKKFPEVWEAPLPEGDFAEMVEQGRREFLKFDPLTLEGNSAIVKVAKLMGGTMVEDEDDVHLVMPDGRTWSYDEVVSGVMPGAAGVLKVADVSLKDIQTGTVKCEKCQLRKSCKKPVPIHAGLLDAMLVAEAPGRWEDDRGMALVGDAGQLLWDELGALGVKREDLFVTNTVKCRPPKNSKPTPDIIDQCNWLADEVKRVKPKVILSMGNTPMYFFTGKETGIMAMNGRTEWNHRANCWVVYSIHPSSCLYTDHGDRRPMLRQALKEFVRLLQQFA